MKIAVLSLVAAFTLVSLGCESEVRPPRPGETCWGLEYPDSAGADFCDAQKCFKKDHTFTADTTSGPGFFCPDDEPCTAWVPGSGGELSGQGFRYDDPTNNWTIALSFNRMLMADGYSLDNFHKYLEMAIVAFPVSAEFDSFSASALDVAEVEFVSYEDGIVHLRFEARAVRNYNIIPTPVYVCAPLKTCDHAACYYGSEDAEGSGESIRATVDIKAPIEQMM